MIGPGSSLHNVSEADAKIEELPVILSIHRAGNEAREEETFPCNDTVRGQQSVEVMEVTLYLSLCTSRMIMLVTA